jgi:TetR/AcrR family transcriptional regulator
LTLRSEISTLLTDQSVTTVTPISHSCCDSAATPKRERRKDARPGELLSAALNLFVEKGYAATRVEEVAAQAGVSKGTLFLYFQSKEELFKAVVRENISGRFNEWNDEIPLFVGTTSDMLAYCLNSWWERVGSTRAAGITKLMMSESKNFPELAAFYQQEVVQPGRALIRRILQRGVDSGEFRPLDLDYAIYNLLAPMMYLILSQHSGCAFMPPEQSFDPKRYIDAQVATLLHGVVANPNNPSKPA